MTYKKTIWIIIPIIITVILGIYLYFHYQKDDNQKNETSVNIDTSTEDIDWTNYEEKDITLSESITLTDSGIYNLTGTLQGSITINTKGNIKLILNGVTINSTSGPAIYIKNADNITISMVEGTTNTLSDSSNYEGLEDDVEGAIFSKDDIILEGNGTLILNGNYGDALVSKDDLIIENGTYIINAKDDGIRGKDSVYIKNGNITINSICDAIKSTNDTDTTKGYVKIENGEINIKTTSTSSDTSSKGIKATNVITISGGTFEINTTDDAIHSNNIIEINGGTFEIASLDDGIHADNSLTITDGNINISKSYEGLEAQDITIKNGKIDITSSDDGINVASKTDDTATLSIYDGTIKVNASGDGLDSNGIIYIYGGTIYVDGPINDGNGALDYDKELIISGGTLVAIGSSGMAQGISSSSTQYGILINLSQRYQAGDIITLTNSTNEEILSYTATKTFLSICYSSSTLKQGETYTLKINGETVQTITVNSIQTTAGTTNQGPGGNRNQGGPRR